MADFAGPHRQHGWRGDHLALGLSAGLHIEAAGRDAVEVDEETVVGVAAEH